MCGCVCLSVSSGFLSVKQTCHLRYFYALLIAEVGADWPFLKALQRGDTKFKIALLPLFLCFPKFKKRALFLALLIAHALFFHKNSAFA